MADAKNLLGRMLAVMEREVSRLEAIEDRGLLTTESDDLCKYMTVSRHLVGKDLEGEDVTCEMSEEEIEKALEAYGRESKAKGEKGE